ncbi:MAG: transcription termination factor NusA [Clostridia bacterium]|nr:transcription termination factor NusA [Clostridia bacterium]
MVNKDFFLALDLLEREKKVSRELLLESLEAGLASAYKKEWGESRNIVVKLNDEKQTIKVYFYRQIVEIVEDEDKEISLEEAKEIKSTYKIGDVVIEDITPKDFSRIAAQTAKQVVMQRLNDAKRDMVVNEMNERQGEILNAIVRRVEGGNVYVEMSGSQMEGVMMIADQIPTEKYQVNSVIKVFLKKIRTTSRGAQVIVSRSSSGFVKRLFELEVPEIKAGLVTVKSIVREAGFRTKIAVASEDTNVDATGACIGNKGVRVNAVVAELAGEKVDVIEWCEDPFEYIARALSPAQVLMVRCVEDTKTATVIVPDEKLSLAIGKSGQNARLAAKLTGWKIDVKPQSSLQAVIDSEEAPATDAKEDDAE